MSIHNNYLYLYKKIKEHPGSSEDLRVLDYGCGKGILVDYGRSQGLEIFGVEMFAAGSGVNIRESALNYGGGGIIKEIVDARIPFPDNSFDCVVCNQVLEHIPDLSPVVSEIYRVLKTKGRFICIFPSLDTYREGHCGVPFAHWFAPRSKILHYWLKFFKILGFGRRKKEKNPDVWANFFTNWLAENTAYKPYKYIEEQLYKVFSRVDKIEEDYLAFRLRVCGHKLSAYIVSLPGLRVITRWICIKIGSHVIVCHNSKPPVFK